MGKVTEYDSLCRELRETMGCADNVDILSTEVDRHTDMTLSARPLCYDLTIGDALVYSFGNLTNAHTVYDVIRADLRGDVWHG